MPLLISHLRPRYGGGRVGAANPRFTSNHARIARAGCQSTTRKNRDRVGIARSRSHVAMPPSAPVAMRWSCFALPREAGRQPRAATRRHHPTLPLTVPRRESKEQKVVQAVPSRDHDHDQP
jgi:hypothetical protein